MVRMIDRSTVGGNRLTTPLEPTAALFNKIRAGDLEAVADLLDRHPELANAVEDGGTALHVAAWENRPRIAGLLLDAGADLDARDARHGMLPIAWANEHGHMKMVRFLYGRGAFVPFQLAAAFGLIEVLTHAIEADGDRINEVRGYGTALHFAALWGRPAVVKLLLEAGADPNLLNENGERALTVARRQTAPEARDAMLVIPSRQVEIQKGCARAASILEEHGALP